MDTDIIPPNKKPISGPISKSTSPTPTISSEPETPSFTPTEEPKKKSNVLTLLLIFIALCGIAFGIYGMFFQAPKTVYKDNETKCEEIKTPSENAGPLGENEFYFYLGELGVKISTPEEYKGKLSYLYNNDGNVLIWGYQDTEKPDFADPLSENSQPLLAITDSINAFSTEKYSFESGEEIFTTQSGKTLYYHIAKFESSDQEDAFLNLALDLKSFFVDTYKYSNI